MGSHLLLAANPNQFTPAGIRCATACKLALWHLRRGGIIEPCVAARAEPWVSVEACISAAAFAQTQAQHPPLVLLGPQPPLPASVEGKCVTAPGPLRDACVPAGMKGHVPAEGLGLSPRPHPLLAGFRVQEPPSSHNCFLHKPALALRGGSHLPGGGAGGESRLLEAGMDPRSLQEARGPKPPGPLWRPRRRAARRRAAGCGGAV